MYCNFKRERIVFLSENIINEESVTAVKLTMFSKKYILTGFQHLYLIYSV